MVCKIVFGLLLVDLAYGSSLSRIIGGSDTTTSKHPHQVSLRNRNGYHICGGSIINANWVLTAAHCVTGAASGYSIGVNDGTLNNGPVFGVSKIFSHPDYNSNGFAGAYPNDVALLRLSSPISLGSGVEAISLAATGQNFDRATCTITGWGNTATGSTVSNPTQLQETTGRILTNSECTSSWGSNYNGNVHICIHNTATGSCNGDSGGPMVCSGVLAGVTSWGYSGCRTDFPSVYARVSTFKEWVDFTVATN
ncbi:trypsin-like [Ruditapes philippinarum]|uniref:trypsin-like n=1 Tax=Ruditapes philippinarum TaxID=129788 RepID=UPI00295AE424|nr:trypsin-like [Ruditapes philippinarum]